MDDDHKIPRPAVDLYTRFIHGEIDRRAFVRGVSRYAVAGLTASAIIDALMPDYALGQQVRKDDERIRASYVTVPSPDGYGAIRGYLVRPYSADSRDAKPAKLPGVVVIHENRGLNPHTEDVARRFALENFMAFAPDTLTSVGGYPGDDYKGGQANALAAILGPDLAAAAPFYGAATPPADVPKIRAAILIHHGALDTRLAADYPAQAAELKRNGVRHEGHLWPDSVHGFFNDATPERYNKVTAPQAWDRTIAWFNQYARSPAA